MSCFIRGSSTPNVFRGGGCLLIIYLERFSMGGQVKESKLIGISLLNGEKLGTGRLRGYLQIYIYKTDPASRERVWISVKD